MSAACLLELAAFHLGDALDEAALAAAGEALGAEVALCALRHHFAFFYQPVG